MKILKIISRLLDYPTQELLDNKELLIEVTSQSQYLPVQLRQDISTLIEARAQIDLYDLQAQYDGLFERGRYVSLLIFEHVHGESRDRGQAMVDLLETYKGKGFELNSSEMPDYIPLFLEFLSEQDEMYAREWMADVSHILALLHERLKQRDSDFHLLFTALLIISGAQIDYDEIKETVSKEEPDDTMEAIDIAWEDKEVRFDDPVGGLSCPSSSSANPGVDQVIEVPISQLERKRQNTAQFTGEGKRNV